MTGDASNPEAAILSSRVADTILGAKESWTRRMFELATQMRADGGGPVHDLSLGNPSLEPPTAWKEAVKGALDDPAPGRHRYMTNAGFPEVRDFLAAREAARYRLEGTEGADVTMTVGAAGALNVVLRSTTEAGEQLLVPAPYFSEYEHYATNVGATLRAVPSLCDEDARFALDVPALLDAIDEKTRVLLLNSPNNPTGAIYSADSLAELAAGLRKKNESRPQRPVLVLEDSPYRDLCYDREFEVPAMIEHYENTVFLTSHSKDLGLAGERIGYALIHPQAQGRALLRRAFAFCNRVLGFVNAPALMQRALPGVLGNPEGRVDVEAYARRARAMAEGLRNLGFDQPDPQAGFFLFPRLPASLREGDGAEGESSDVKLTELLRAERCIVVPGTAFGVPGHLRLSMAVDDAAVEGALAAFKRVCA